MANSLSKLRNAQKDLINDAMRDLLDPSVFRGELAPNPFLGANYGYTSSGSAGGVINVIDKFPFTADTNATDVGDLTVTRGSVAGQSSKVSGYACGGLTEPPNPSVINVIDKFPFASDGNATDVGDLTLGRYHATGQSSTVSGYGYTSGGYGDPYSLFPGITNGIDKFPFASDGNATDVGDLTVAKEPAAGQSSDVSGYNSGGIKPPPTPHSNVIDKFPFASDANATDVGDLTLLMSAATGQSSNVSGYTSGGQSGPPYVNSTVIQKFPFASDGNATDVGDLTIARKWIGGGQSSTASGYTSGGFVPSYSNVIDKFPFASDGTATDVGDLTVARVFGAGQQY